MQKDCNTEPGEVPPTRHIGFLKYAEQFSDAASVIVRAGQAAYTRISTTYLYGHAIELALKSILVKHGATDGELREIGHNLDNCLTKVTACPESEYMDDVLRGIVALLNPVYSGKYLEYHPGDMFMQLPCETTMQKAVASLIARLDAYYRADFRSRC